LLRGDMPREQFYAQILDELGTFQK
jgi:hypothetical protein